MGQTHFPCPWESDVSPNPHGSPAHMHTCVPHLATHTHTDRVHPPPCLWSLRAAPGFAITVTLVHPRRAEARCSGPGPRPAKKGAVITWPRGAPHTRAFHPGPRPARPQPRRSLQPPARSLARVGGGLGEGGRGAPPHLQSDAQWWCWVPGTTDRVGSTSRDAGGTLHPFGFIKDGWDSRWPPVGAYTKDATGDFLDKCAALTQRSEPRAWSPTILIPCAGKSPAS